MIYFLMAILLINIILIIFLEKKTTNPIILFSGIWLVSLFLTSLQLYNMIPYSNKAILLIAEGIISFNLGAFICLYIHTKKDKLKKDKDNSANSIDDKEVKVKETNINNRILLVLVSLGVIMLLFLSIKVVILLSNGVEYSSIRKLYYSYDEQSLISNETIFTIFDWTVATLIAVLTPTVIMGIITKKIKKSVIIGYVIMILLYILSTSGRAPIIVITIELILAIILNKEKIGKKGKKIFITVIAGLMTGMIVMTTLRTASNKNREVNSIYAYLSMPLPYFSKMVDYIDSNDLETHGIATIYGPYLLVQKGVKALTGYKFGNATDLANIITKPQNGWIRIFEDTTDYYNAYATMFYNFYLDFRSVGIIVFSFIYGIGMEKVYIEMNRKKSIKMAIIYLMLVSGLVQSFISWQFSSPTVIIGIILVNIIFCEKRMINNDKGIGFWNNRKSWWRRKCNNELLSKNR